ncbi:substrate-binding periplasmic protein [Aeromonas veronii]|uniref:substrate-binding periplasmic protein n=1 Tax=Aeromonas veronii TaxID=654 RepID=UPI0032EB9B59
MSLRTLLLSCSFWLLVPCASAVTVIAGQVPPYVIQSQQGAPSGMVIEVLEEAARRLHEPLHIELMPMARAVEQARYRADVLLVPPVKSPQRAPRFLWITPLLDEAFVLVTHRHHHPAPVTVGELPSLSLGAMRGSYGHSLSRTLPEQRVETVAEELNNANKLARGRIQVWAVAWNTARYAQRQAGLPLNDLVRGDTLQTTPLYLAAHPGFPPKEAARWRQVIHEMRADGTLARILKQYDYQTP